jgi:hypothetical protein
VSGTRTGAVLTIGAVRPPDCGLCPKWPIDRSTWTDSPVPDSEEAGDSTA